MYPGRGAVEYAFSEEKLRNMQRRNPRKSPKPPWH